MTLHKLETPKSPSDSIDYYALIAEMPIKNFATHFGNLYGGFYLRVRQWRLYGTDLIGEERCFNYSVRIENKDNVSIYCVDRLATEDVTNNLVAVYDEENFKIKFYVKPMMTNAIVYLNLLDESPEQRLKVYKQPLFYTNITPNFVCKKWKPHPIAYFNGSKKVALGQTYDMDTGFFAPSKYSITYVEADILLRSNSGKYYKTKQLIVSSYESWDDSPVIQSVSTVYADTTDTIGTTLNWKFINGELVVSITAVNETTDVKVLAQNKFI